MVEHNFSGKTSSAFEFNESTIINFDCYYLNCPTSFSCSSQMSNLILKMAYKNDLRLEILLNQFLPMLSKVSELCHLNTILSKSDKNGFFS